MASVELDESDWNQLLNVLWNASGPGISCGLTHPLVMKIGEQLRKQAQANGVQFVPRDTTEGIVKERAKKQ